MKLSRALHSRIEDPTNEPGLAVDAKLSGVVREIGAGTTTFHWM